MAFDSVRWVALVSVMLIAVTAQEDKKDDGKYQVYLLYT